MWTAPQLQRLLVAFNAFLRFCVAMVATSLVSGNGRRCVSASDNMTMKPERWSYEQGVYQVLRV
jgi:hypothetical protein